MNRLSTSYLSIDGVFFSLLLNSKKNIDDTTVELIKPRKRRREYVENRMRSASSVRVFTGRTLQLSILSVSDYDAKNDRKKALKLINR